MPDEWLTYAEAGERMGVSAEAARQLAIRRKWPRRTPNEHGAKAQILVPEDMLDRPRTALDGEHTPSEQPDNDFHAETLNALRDAVNTLREQLEQAAFRADQAAADTKAAGERHTVEMREVRDRHAEDVAWHRAELARVQSRVEELERAATAASGAAARPWWRRWRSR